MSRPDLFHLFLWLSPPPPGIAYFPQCIYPCVSCLSVPVRLVCLVKSTSVFFPYSFCYSPFSSPPGFDPCLFLDFVRPFCLPWPRACLTLCTSWPLIWFWYFCLSTAILLPTTFWINKHLRLQPSASCVCIWVSPCALIERTGHDRPSRLGPALPRCLPAGSHH